MASSAVSQNTKPRARDLGIPLDGTPGSLNALTDVKGVAVGHTTLISGEGKLKVGLGPVRTGVTAILPRGLKFAEPVFAGWFSLNGNGEMAGTTWIEESGFLEGPVLLTNTSSVGTVRDASSNGGPNEAIRSKRGSCPWLPKRLMATSTTRTDSTSKRNTSLMR
jgi:D-aminopeptidase